MTEGKVSVAVLVRVSTVKQETARQISELQEYAVGKGYEMLEVCQETACAAPNNSREKGKSRRCWSMKFRELLGETVWRIAL